MGTMFLHASAQELVDRRAHEREDVNLAAYGSMQNETSIECIVLNLSEGGALIGFSRTDIVPARLRLHIPQLKTVFECETVWNKNGEAGVRFLSRQPCKQSGR